MNYPYIVSDNSYLEEVYHYVLFIFPQVNMLKMLSFNHSIIFLFKFHISILCFV